MTTRCDLCNYLCYTLQTIGITEMESPHKPMQMLAVCNDCKAELIENRPTFDTIIHEHNAPDATEPTPTHTGKELDILTSSEFHFERLNELHRASLKKPLHAPATQQRSEHIELLKSTLAAIGLMTLAALVGIGIAAVLHFGL